MYLMAKFAAYWWVCMDHYSGYDLQLTSAFCEFSIDEVPVNTTCTSAIGLTHVAIAMLYAFYIKTIHNIFPLV